MCTINKWKIIQGVGLDKRHSVSFYYNKDPVAFCSLQCLLNANWITFDSCFVGTKQSCYLHSSYLSLRPDTGNMHWEYRRSCVTTTGTGKI